jgi:hypothetical protein
MTDLTRRPLDDDALGMALRDLATQIDWPNGDASPDLATRVRVAIDARPVAAPRPWWRPAGRGLVIALIALLAFAAVAGAVVLGLPGLRLILAEPSATPPIASPGASSSAGVSGSVPPSGAARMPGSGLGLGRATDLDTARAAVDRPIPLPSDPTVGLPDAVYLDADKADAVALVWAPRPDLPATLDPDVGLILMSFDGSLADEYYLKLIGNGTTVTTVSVGGERGYWIDGDPHQFFFEDATGEFIHDDRRWVGDALIWSDGTTTYRLETSLGREPAIEIAEGLR